jgi:ABC-type multidrug transport system ATPase subunit
LQGISFTVQRGTIHGFIGPNGAGKSTLIKSLMGGIIPNSGKIYLADRKGGGDEYINQKIGYMFEKVKFSDDLTVGDFIYLAGQARRIPLPQVENRLRKSDLNNHRKKKCQQLSTG